MKKLPDKSSIRTGMQDTGRIYSNVRPYANFLSSTGFYRMIASILLGGLFGYESLADPIIEIFQVLGDSLIPFALLARDRHSPLLSPISFV
jgi:hypothetical protein